MAQPNRLCYKKETFSFRYDIWHNLTGYATKKRLFHLDMIYGTTSFRYGYDIWHNLTGYATKKRVFHLEMGIMYLFGLF